MPALRLTLEKIKANARKAYDESRLGFQCGEYFCFYAGRNTNAAGKHSVCAIGASLLSGSRAEYIISNHNDSSIRQLIEDGLVEIKSDDIIEVITIQRTHDDLVKAKDIGYGYESLQWKFLRLIDHPSVAGRAFI